MLLNNLGVRFYIEVLFTFYSPAGAVMVLVLLVSVSMDLACTNESVKCNFDILMQPI